MTSNIRGPEGPRSLPPSGSAAEGNAPPDLPRSLDRVLSMRQGGLSARSGPCGDVPFEGGRIGPRQALVERSLSESRTRFVDGGLASLPGQSGLVGLLAFFGGVSVGGQESVAQRLSTALRKEVPFDALLSGFGGGGGPPLNGIGQLAEEAAQHVGRLALGLADRLLDPGPNGLFAKVDDSIMSGLRDEAARLIGSGQDDARRSVRQLCHEVLLDRGVLPGLLEVAGKSDPPRGLQQAVLSIHIVAGGNLSRISPDLAVHLEPLRYGFAQRFDELLASLKIPGFAA